MAPDELAPLRPAEFCDLEQRLVASMVMRKKRRVKMEPVQELKLEILHFIQTLDPEPEQFRGALAEAVIEVSGGLSTGPAQAVASDLQMDWDLACASPGFVDWLRAAAAKQASANG